MKLYHSFYGEAGNALLAPRGVYMHGNLLVVSDTGQNRVFIWKNFQFQQNQKPDVVLGQIKNNNTERNAGESISASSLQYPSGIWTNGEKLIVADAWNHRVLIWHNLPERNFQPADTVIGQPDFESNQPNINGIGKLPTAQTLHWPYSVHSNGMYLWIADTGNRRVLVYNTIPIKNGTAANEVIGQLTFQDKDYDNENAVWPYSVKVNESGSLLIADTQYYRVLFWNNWTNAMNQKADCILGQESMYDNGQNQYNLKPNAHTLNWVYDACFFNQGIAIADTGNSRIIIHQELPVKNNRKAEVLVGQPTFETNGESSLSFTTQLNHEMYWPFSINSTNDFLVLADTGNHRILFYKKAV